ncbi:MAG: GNAT family N-acetyltransferase [Pirellulales bacterium]|nr:GNAT family N-acetyltransferase [Pirellulales bacterium]
MHVPGSPVIDEKSKASGPTVGPFDVDADREAILALWRRNLPEGTADRYAWLYDSGRARSWIAREDKSGAIGAVGLMSRRLRLFGEEYPAGGPIDLNVDRTHRLGGLALRLQRSVTAEVDQGRLALIYGVPNTQSEPVLRRVGYEIVGPVQRWARPLRSHEYLHDRLPGGALGKTASATVDAALWLRSPESRYRRRREHRVEITDCFDVRFDRLWRQAAPQFSVIGQRTAEYLNWRFRDAPGTAYRALCVGDRNDSLLGYLVYTCRDGVAYVADFLHADDSVGDAVLAEFINLMRVQKAKAIVTIFTGAPAAVKRLRRFGFRRRSSSWKIMVHTDALRLGIPRYKLLDVGKWFFTRADIDTEF